jgi:hypothetical protein
MSSNSQKGELYVDENDWQFFVERSQSLGQK